MHVDAAVSGACAWPTRGWYMMYGAPSNLTKYLKFVKLVPASRMSSDAPIIGCEDKPVGSADFSGITSGTRSARRKCPWLALSTKELAKCTFAGFEHCGENGELRQPRNSGPHNHRPTVTGGGVAGQLFFQHGGSLQHCRPLQHVGVITGDTRQFNAGGIRVPAEQLIIK